MKLYKATVSSRTLNDIEKYITHAGKRSSVNEYIYLLMLRLLNDELSRVVSIMSYSSKSQSYKAEMVNLISEEIKFLHDNKTEFINNGYLKNTSETLIISCIQLEEDKIHIHLDL